MFRRLIASRSRSRWVALLPALVLAANAAIPASAGEGDLYTVVWVDGVTTTSTLDLAGGTTSATLRITNDAASPNALGSASVTLPADYELVDTQLLGATVEFHDLNLAAGSSTELTIDVRTPCLPNTTAETWVTAAKVSSDFSGDDGFALDPETSDPSTTRDDTSCQVRFANQPNTTKTNNVIKAGYNSTNPELQVEIFDPETDDVVDTSADVVLSPNENPAGGAIAGDSVAAVNGTATFSNVTLDKPGPYTLDADSEVATNTATSDEFLVGDTVAKCTGPGCKFNQASGGTTYTTTPKNGSNGATFVAALNLANLRIDCEFAPYDYPASRQPNAVWYLYDDGATKSYKTNVIFIPSNIVKATPENGASKYRVCYSSPKPFKDRFGHDAPADDQRDGNPSDYFGVTWYTGLLPDCAKKNPVPPCVVSWTGQGAGNRVGTFLTPPGDPSYR